MSGNDWEGQGAKRITSAKDFEATVVPSLLLLHYQEGGNLCARSWTGPHWPPSHSFRKTAFRVCMSLRILCFCGCFFRCFFGDRRRWDEMASTHPFRRRTCSVSKGCVVKFFFSFNLRMYVVPPTVKLYSYSSYAKELKRGKSVVVRDRAAPKQYR